MVKVVYYHLGRQGPPRKTEAHPLNITEANLHHPAAPISACTVQTAASQPSKLHARFGPSLTFTLDLNRRQTTPRSFAMAILGTALNGIGVLLLTHA